jgi:hypothetical protein
VVEGYVEYGPTFCLCSGGWVKAVFTEALGEEVGLDLVETIGRGDERREIFVHPTPPRSRGPAEL